MGTAAEAGARVSRVLLLDDDDLFCRVMEKKARDAGVSLVSCGSLDELARLSSHRAFDAVILDYYLGGEVTGEHVASVLGGRPILLISSERQPPHRKLPASIKGFLLKSEGAESILARALLLIAPNTRGTDDGTRARLRGSGTREALLTSIRGLVGPADNSVLQEVIDLYVAQTAASLLSLHAGLKKKNPDSVCPLSQDLEASSRNVGAIRLASWFSRLNEAAATGRWPRTKTLWRGIEREFRKVRDLLERED
jgi:CheY-like chemotaxis protein